MQTKTTLQLARERFGYTLQDMPNIDPGLSYDPIGNRPIDVDWDRASVIDPEADPVINRGWPIDMRAAMLKHESIEEVSEALDSLPVCLVSAYDGAETDDPEAWLLVLTGGGMDFSWELVEAYARLGNMPPVTLADLPRMSGRGESDIDRQLVALCIASCESMRDRSQRTIDSLQTICK